MIRLFRKPKPRPLNTQECARELAKAGAKQRADATMRLIRERCVDLRRGPVIPITPRDENIAKVRRASH